MSQILEELRKGYDEKAREYEAEGPFLDELPDDLDLEKFERGRFFFIKNVSQCFNAMLFSLVCGLSVINLLEVLVATEVTAKPRQSAMRYIRTAVHVLKWHYGNVWNAKSSAGMSIRAVRQVHNKTRVFMTEQENNLKTKTLSNSQIKSKLYVSQYDMSLVQCGFMGAIVMYAREFGIRCTKSDLDDYVYFWRWLGHLLGINERNNICYGGYDRAYSACKAIEHEILFPALMDPPEHFQPMAKAFTDGMNMLSYTKFYNPEFIIALTFENAGVDIPCTITLSDRVRMRVWKVLILFMYYVPGFSWCMNKMIEIAFKCKQMT